jgi:hypothetical protein
LDGFANHTSSQHIHAFLALSFDIADSYWLSTGDPGWFKGGILTAICIMSVIVALQISLFLVLKVPVWTWSLLFP